MQIARMSRDEKTLWGLGVIFGGMIIIFNWGRLEKNIFNYFGFVC